VDTSPPPRSRGAAIATFAAVLVATAVLAVFAQGALVRDGLAASVSPFATAGWLGLAIAGSAIAWAALVRWRGLEPACAGLTFTMAEALDAAIGLAVGAIAALAAFGACVLVGALELGARAPPEMAPTPDVAIVALVAFAAGALFQQVTTVAGLVGSLRLAFSDATSALVPAAIFAALRVTQPHASLVSTWNAGLVAVACTVFFLSGPLVGRRAGPSLGLSVGLHAGWSFTIPIALGSPLAGSSAPWVFVRTTSTNDAWTGGAYGLEGGVAATVVWGVLLAWASLRLRRRLGG